MQCLHELHTISIQFIYTFTCCLLLSFSHLRSVPLSRE